MDGVYNTVLHPVNINNSHRTGMNEEISKTLVTMGQAGIGVVIVLTNIALLIFYKQKSKKTDITFLILANLTTSDIIFGMAFIIRVALILAEPPYLTEACHIILSVGMMSTVTSGWCIFLLSCQVSKLSKIMKKFII